MTQTGVHVRPLPAPARLPTDGWADGPVVETTTELHPVRWVGDRDAALAIGQRVAGVHVEWKPETPSTGTLWLYCPSDGSWAAVEVTGPRPFEVTQVGPRRLLDEVLSAYRWWLGHDRPTVGTGRSPWTTAGNGSSWPRPAQSM